MVSRSGGTTSPSSPAGGTEAASSAGDARQLRRAGVATGEAVVIEPLDAVRAAAVAGHEAEQMAGEGGLALAARARVDACLERLEADARQLALVHGERDAPRTGLRRETTDQPVPGRAVESLARIGLLLGGVEVEDAGERLDDARRGGPAGMSLG